MGKASVRKAHPKRVEKLHSWACIYYHSKDQLFLNANVDDLKMVGKADNIKPMWKSSRKVLDLDPETDLVDHVCLGCTQINHKPPREVVGSKQEFFAQLMSKKGSEPKEGDTYTSSTLHTPSPAGMCRRTRLADPSLRRLTCILRY